MAIFNSLGSNYSPNFVLKSIFGLGSAKDTRVVVENLQARYNGKVTLTYKGRQALELALKKTKLPPKSRVGINGFTCYVVYQAVVNAGYEPVFLDVSEDSLHYGFHELDKAHDLKAVIIQNTLGLPADLSAIQAFCKKHDIMVIEDLAHSMGAIYENGEEAGTVGDLTMLSFSQDKPLDVVAGGACIDRRYEIELKGLPSISLWQRVKNRFYPFWTTLIRDLYPVRLGRYLHFALKKLRLLATPMSDNVKGVQRMTGLATHLLVDRLRTQTAELEHRRKIAQVYAQNLPSAMQLKFYGQPSYLRFPIRVKNRHAVVGRLKKHRIHIGDTWYNAPIAPKKYLEKTTYKAGECPQAEALAACIVNLPTHRFVTPQIANNIAERIKNIEEL